MFLFSGYSTQSVMIRENFALEKLGKLNSRKLQKKPHYTVLCLLNHTVICYTSNNSIQYNMPRIN